MMQPMARATPQHDVIFGDAREVLRGLPDASVHLVVTSPPYGTIKDYGGDPREIGHPQGVPAYLAALAEVWRECSRLLPPGCRLAVNVGDQYLRARDHGRYRVLPIPAETIRAGCEAG